MSGGTPPWRRPRCRPTRRKTIAPPLWPGVRSRSCAAEPPRAPGVLQHPAPRPAVFRPPHPSDAELAGHWTLSARDIAFILTNHRGAATLCRWARPRCGLRQHGRFLTTDTPVPPPLLGARCRQRDLIPLVALSSPVRSTTETDDARASAASLGGRLFDAEAHTALREGVVAQVAQPRSVVDLVEKASARLRTPRLLLPGRTALERTVHAAHAEAAPRLFARLAQALSDETKQAIDG